MYVANEPIKRGVYGNYNSVRQERIYNRSRLVGYPQPSYDVGIRSKWLSCVCVKCVQVEFGKDGSLKASERISGLGEKGASPRGEERQEGQRWTGWEAAARQPQRRTEGGGGAQGQEDDRSSKEKESQRARPKGRSSAWT